MPIPEGLVAMARLIAKEQDDRSVVKLGTGPLSHF